MKLKILIIVSFMLLASIFSIAEENKDGEVCIYYFYEKNEGIDFINNLEENFSFLKVVPFQVEENYVKYQEMTELYNASDCLPILFMGNKWYCFKELNETFFDDIIKMRELGGVECPYCNESYVFPKKVCVVEFYNFSDYEENGIISRLNNLLSQNIKYLNINRFDILQEDNKTLFLDLCEEYKINISTPAVFMGKNAYNLNEENIYEVSEEAIKYKEVGLPCPSIESNKTICLVFFYDPVCETCMEAKEKIDYLRIKYPLHVVEYNVLTDEGIEKLFDYYHSFNVSKDEMSSFAIFVGDKYFYKNSQLPELENEIKKYVGKGLPCPEVEAGGDAESVLRGFTLLTVVVGGLLDGINPCAFATLVFFIAYLERMKHERKVLLAIGVAFSLSVFVGYFMIGFGVLEFYYRIEGVGTLSKITYLFAGIFSLVIASLNLFDFFYMEKSRAVLQLPAFLKKRRGRVIKILSGDRGVVFLSILAFVTGFAISMLEFVCTGQILFPVMAVIKSASPLRATAILYLLLYTSMFIVPLLAILAFFYMGYSSKILGEKQKTRHRIIKLLTSILLFIIGGYILYISLL